MDVQPFQICRGFSAAGAAHILGKLEFDNIATGLTQLCASQVEPLSKVCIYLAGQLELTNRAVFFCNFCL